MRRPASERYFVMREYGSGWETTGWSRRLDSARVRAGREGWVVLAEDKTSASRMLSAHVELVSGTRGNNHDIWRGTP